MRIFFGAAILLLSCGRLAAQHIDAIINPTAVENVEKVLSSDAMRGRRTFTPDIDRAAAFIEGQFRKAGLQTLDHGSSFLQPFTLAQVKTLSVNATLDGTIIPQDHIVMVASSEHVSLNENSGYQKVYIKAGDRLTGSAMKYLSASRNEHINYLVIVDTSFSRSFSRLGRYGRQQFKSPNNIIFVLTATDPVHYSITADQQIQSEQKLANVVGILPGRSKKNEYVIFSGHYDHLGIGQPDEKGDSIYNGANDDASGSTAVIMLANYYAKLRNNERTLVFVTFTAEEIGGYGSQYFSLQFDPASVMAMFNIEMIGTESKWGVNSAYITGYERTDMGAILEKNLKGTPFTFYPDPYPQEQLFFRSDNATLAFQGVPAHTISTSKMDNEPYYHKPGDEIGTLDMKNMARVIRSIALSARSIIAGTDTPSRVDVSQLTR